ncbi:RNA polymerase sigma factor [Caulobacter sp. 1776]|uniref:RNA polymerase sigma factor n=1 Tax=Caulobacter sp. 1776 TaxID=3156420 RepID=UPI003393054B
MAGANGAGVDEAAFMAEAAALRPALHRYCARLLGSVLDAEDVVQDALVRALVALRGLDAPPEPRAWLFRIAHNRALDLLRSRTVRAAQPIEAADDLADPDHEPADETLMRQEAVGTALDRFQGLPVIQRSVVILKDVLGQSLQEIAGLLDLTVDAVKAHLARGRARLRTINAQPPAAVPPVRPVSPAVARYAALFNGRDWEALRALLVDDVRLAQSNLPPRVGAADVGMFFGAYARLEPVFLAPAWLEGREVLAVFAAEGDARPIYLMWLDWRDGGIAFIRDYRYVPYVIEAADLRLAP